ncbi:MAG: alkaline phosphatase family protein [Candidatus Hydrogenedentes bacterium]|nr:alkaline phosphatase family protein [Candidatus Hydrogenedentota bacterium]
MNCLRSDVSLFAAANALAVFSFACAGLLSANAAQEAPVAKTSAAGRVVILGFDGVDPDVAKTMLDKGELPNLDKLRKQGTFAPLKSANPPQSPTAWSSFTTCKRPGNHGVYDFVRRTPREYRPGVGFGSALHATLNPDGSVAQRARFESVRKGDSFWSVADKQGVPCKILLVPFAYPADDLTQGCMLCGLGVPDIRGVTSTFFSFSEDYKTQENVSGGILFPLTFENNTAKVMIPGARNPQVKLSNAPGAFVEAPVEFTADRDARKVTMTVPGGIVTLAEGEWSKWFEWSFQVTPQFTVKAISRFHVVEAGKLVRVYMTCLQFHPKEPYMRLSSPEAYSGELADRYGLYKTIGWEYDTHALRQDALLEDAFLEDVKRTSDWQEHLCLDEIDRGNFRLLISAWTAQDRVSHMFWRFRDPKHPLYTEEGAKKYGRAVEDTYLRMDETVGKVMAKLQPDDVLMVMSDHGFKSFRMGFNVNTWLIRNGYLAVKGKSDRAAAFNDQEFLQGYDWSQTKAYSLGLGSIYLNLKGREGQGTVDPSQADAVIAELRSKLLEVTDPATGDKVFRAVYTREEYPGVAHADAPDLQLGYADGYQSSKATAKGSAPKDLFEPNTDKWSGEHAASDVAFTPGILFSNKPIASSEPAIIDIGVTALEYLGVPAPADFEGKSLFKK